MQRDITLDDIDIDKIIEVIPSRNPDTDIRFALPVPNFLETDDGEVLVKKHWFIEHFKKSDQTVQIRLRFKNFKDNCIQGVRINGEGSIVFMGKGFHTYKEIMKDLNDNYADITKIGLEDISNILTKTRVMYGIVDRYNKKVPEIVDTMDPVEGLQSDVPGYGGFFYKKRVSSALYVKGQGQFIDGPTVTPQKFEDGALIVFQNIDQDQLREKLSKNKNDLTAKLVQKDVFLQTRNYKDGSKINIDTIPFI